jgi:glycosyltransferase involved in cell wall biosynthesis
MPELSGTQARVLFVDSGIALAGGQHSLLDILRNLDRDRYLPLVACPPAGELPGRCRELGVVWRDLPFSSVHASRKGESGLRGLGAMWEGVLRLRRVLIEEGMDLVHANTFKAALAAGPAARSAGKPMVFHARTSLTHGPLGLLVRAMAARVLVISGSVASCYGGTSNAGVQLLPSGVDAEHFAPRRAHNPSGRVGYLGRISEEKGLVTLVDSAVLVADSFPRVRFALGGTALTSEDLVYERRVRSRISNLGLEGILEMRGPVSDPRAFLEECDLVVLPSRREALGRVMLEAMAMEKPVVATREGGPAEVIADGETGLLVPVGDPEALAGSILRLLADPAEAGLMGRRARRVVVERYSSRVVTDRLMGIYDEVLEERTGGNRREGRLW